MKIYAISNDNNCVELFFNSEEEADNAFNSVSKNKNGVGEIIDSSGKKKTINIICGYSTFKSDMTIYLKK